MVYFFKRLFLFSLLFLLFDRSLVLLRNYMPKLEVDTRLEKVINKQIKADVLVFGSSRGARNIIASQITDSLGVSAYNLSYPGGDIEFQYFVFQRVIEYHKPKIVLLSIDEGSELSMSKIIKFRYDRLYPLVKYDLILNELIRKKQKNELLSNFFILHQLTKSSFDIRKKKETPYDHILPCGSIPVSFQTSSFNKKYYNEFYSYDCSKEYYYKRNCFLSMVKLCKTNNIKLILVFPPNFHTFRESFFNRILYLSKGNCYVMKYNVAEKRFLSSDYFNDESHLMKNGAEIFTNEIIDFIKNNNLYNQRK